MSVPERGEEWPYICVECGVSNCKLWVMYGVYGRNSEMTYRCVICAGKYTKVDITRMNAKGEMINKEYEEIGILKMSSGIGHFFPAIAMDDNIGHWLNKRHASDFALTRWESLPTFPKK